MKDGGPAPEWPAYDPDVAWFERATRRMKRSGTAFLIVLALILIAFLALLHALSTATSGWLMPNLGGSILLTGLALLCIPPILLYSLATGLSAARARPVVWFWLVPEILLLLLILASVAVAILGK